MGCDSCQRSDNLLKVIQHFQSETTCTLGRCDHVPSSEAEAVLEKMAQAALDSGLFGKRPRSWTEIRLAERARRVTWPFICGFNKSCFQFLRTGADRISAARVLRPHAEEPCASSAKPTREIEAIHPGEEIDAGHDDGSRTGVSPSDGHCHLSP